MSHLFSRMMDTHVINLKKPLPRVKITCGNSTIICKHDTIFGDYCAYQFDNSDRSLIENVIECLTQILSEDA